MQVWKPQHLAAGTEAGIGLQSRAMSHTLSDRQRRAREIELDPNYFLRQHEAGRAAAKEERHRRRIVQLWAERLRLGRAASFYPTIGTAIAAGLPWLQAQCPACRTIGEVDLRTIDVHADAPISSLIPRLSCTRCRPHAPFAQLTGLTETETIAHHRPAYMPRRRG